MSLLRKISGFLLAIVFVYGGCGAALAATINLDNSAGTPSNSGTWVSGGNSAYNGQTTIYNGQEWGYSWNATVMPGGNPGYMWSASTISQNVNIVTGGSIWGDAGTQDYVGNNVLTITGGSNGTIETDFTQIAAAPGSGNGNRFEITSSNTATDYITAGKTVDVGWGNITINTGGTISGNIITSGSGTGGNTSRDNPDTGTASTNKGVNGSSTWDIGGGKIQGNLTSYTDGSQTGNVGDTFNIGTTTGGYALVFDSTTNGTLEVTANSTVNFGEEQDGSNTRLYADVDNYTVKTTGVHNDINVLGQVNFTDNSLINISGAANSDGYNNIYIGLGSTTLQGTGSKIFLGKIQIDTRQNNLVFGNNTVVTGTTLANSGGTRGSGIINADQNTITFENWTHYQDSAHWVVNHNNHTLNIKEAADFDGDIEFTGSGITTNVNLAGYDPDGNGPAPLTPPPTMTGQVVYETAAGAPNVKNTTNISAGRLDDLTGHGSFISSNLVDSDYNITGGATTLIVSGQTDALLAADRTTSTYTVTGGNIHNVRERTGAAVTDNTGTSGSYEATYSDKDKVLDADGNALGHNMTVGGGVSKVNSDDGRIFQSYSLLNLGTLTLTDTTDGKKVLLRIGGWNGANNWLADTISNQAGVNGNGTNITQGAYGNQLTANEVMIETNTKLIIHEDADYMGTVGARAPTDVNRNVVNYTLVEGELTIDRTTIHGTNEGEAQIEVANGGILYGFGEFKSATDHDPRRAQLIGDLTLKTGSTIQPYDHSLAPEYYKWGLRDGTNGEYELFPADEDVGPGNGVSYDLYGAEHRGVVFQVDVGTNGVGGLTTFEQATTIRTRLFAVADGKTVNITGDGNGLGTYYSDSLLTDSTDYQDVLDAVNNLLAQNKQLEAQTVKVQADPVFGFHYDLKSKQEYEIYEGNGLNDTQTYYYAIANSVNSVSQLSGYDDANHLYNRLILKSDMLGEYTFVQRENEEGVYLRYRMLAYHPTEGGMKRSMEEQGHENEIVPAQYLDDIRYPFYRDPADGGGSAHAHLFPDDPSATPNTGGQADSYDQSGYDGTMWGDGTGFYADPDLETNYPVFDNVREEWIKDWEDLFLGMQLTVGSNARLYRAIRTITPEIYANSSETALNTMYQFTRLRERNAMSALYQVENDLFCRAESQAEGEMFDPLADAGIADRFVANPVRFWASGFGQYGNYRKTGAVSDGYDTRTWGGAVGMIKEFGDYYAGATIGYADSKNTYDNIVGTGKAKSYMAEALVGARLFGLGFAELYGSYSYGENNVNRVVDFDDTGPGGTGHHYLGRAHGDFASHIIGGGFRLGYQKVICDSWLLVPTIGFNVMHYRAESFTEKGRTSMANRFVMDKGSMDRTVYRVPLEVRLNRVFALGRVVVTPEVRAGISPILGDTRGSAKARWIGDPISGRYFKSLGAKRGNYEAWVGGTLELSRRGRMYVAGNYDYTHSSKTGAHSFSIQGGFNF